jgi:polyisoprenoid-binding protein YceI
MTKYALQTVLLIALTITCTTGIKSQNISLTGSDNTVVVTGTSTLHDWEMELLEFKTTAEINKNDDGSFEVTNAVFSANANNLTSDNSLMDKKTHEALRAKKAPEISFRQSTPITLDIEGEKSFRIKGNLKFAGHANSVSIPINVTSQDDGSLLVKGTATLLMTDYNMEPPTAMFGTVKAGDEIKVTINLKLQ